MRLHFLNVKSGDCSIIEHSSGNTTIIDISNGKEIDSNLLDEALGLIFASQGNYHQKKNPENPIAYLKNLNVKSIMRFILTHPDMDHMDGIKALFANFNIANFWNVKNNKTIATFESCSFMKEDWQFYQTLKKSTENPKTLHLTDDNDHGENDGIYILSPTKKIIEQSNGTAKYNELSYVILWITNGFKIMISGDSEDMAWEHIIRKYSKLVSNIDVLLAPHHGRSSGRDFSFLDTLKPKYTLLGNAKSKHLEYDKYKKYGKTITNNQGGNIILELDKDGLNILIENHTFAKDNHCMNKLYHKEIAKKTYYYMDIISE